MERYLFMKSLTASLEKEDFIKKVFSVYLTTIAIFTGMSGLVGFTIGLRDIFKMNTSGIIGGIIFEGLFVIGIYAVVHRLLIGSEKIKNISEKDSIFTRIGTQILKSLGEAYGIFASVMAIGGGIFIWFGGPGVRSANTLFRVINHYYTFSGLRGETFVQGLSFMVRGVAYAFLISLGVFVVSELFIAIVNSSRSSGR